MRAPALRSFLIPVLVALVLLATSTLLAAPSRDALVSAAPVRGGSGVALSLVLTGRESGQTNSSNNTGNQFGTSITTFINWFLATLEDVIVACIVILLAGGIANYVLVGRNRKPWVVPPRPAELGGAAAAKSPASSSPYWLPPPVDLSSSATSEPLPSPSGPSTSGSPFVPPPPPSEESPLPPPSPAPPPPPPPESE